MSFNLFGDLCKGIVLSLLYIAVAEDQVFSVSSLLRYTMYYYILNILFLNIDVNRDLLITVFVSKCISVILEDRMKQQQQVPVHAENHTEDYNSPTSNPNLSIAHQPATIKP
jgi:hypothetical protein